MLSNLSYFDSKGEVLEEIVSHMKGSACEMHLQVYKFSIDYKNKSGVYPSPDLLEVEYNGLFTREEAEISEMIIFRFLDLLVEEGVKERVSKALLKGDFEEARRGLEVSLKVKDKEYTIKDAFNYYEELLKRPAGILSGVKEIDEVLKGFSYGTMSVIAAPPGNFKTTYGLSILYNASFKLGFNSIYLSFEEKPSDLWFNLISRRSYEIGKQVPAEKIKKGLLADGELEIVKDIQGSWDTESKGKIYIYHPYDIGGFSFSRFVGFLDEKDAKGEIALVIVDYLQLMKFYRPAGIKVEDTLEYYVRVFTDLSVKYKKRGFVLIILAQVNREGWKLLSKEREASLFHLAECNELERSANAAIIMYATDEMKMANQVSMRVLKNRSGLVQSEAIVQYVNPQYYIVGEADFETIFSVESINLMEGIGKEGIFT